jgi:DNA-binding NarL/FixJ family response regulator
MSDDIKQIRILAVDDHPLLRQGIAGLIADEGVMIQGGRSRHGRSIRSKRDFYLPVLMENFPDEHQSS